MERMGGYQTLNVFHNENDEIREDNYNDVMPIENDVMVHVVPEHNKTRWNHVADLDTFFQRIYNYHQSHGFICMLVKDISEILKYVFVIMFAYFLLHGVDYDILFKRKFIDPENPLTKVSLFDAFIPFGQWNTSFNFWWSALLWSVVFIGICRLAVVFHNAVRNWETRAFFKTALGVPDAELDNLTWHDVQSKLRAVQRDQQMCIHKQDLTELDIHHRILRFENYFVAMVNKSLLPLRFHVPVIGEQIFLTDDLKQTLEYILFRMPYFGGPFEKKWHLNEDYKKISKRNELAKALSRRILFSAIICFIVFPIQVAWQILYKFCNYAEIVKREPGFLTVRRWSLHGRLFFRHFNELDHELNARLSKARTPAMKYMAMSTTPVLTIIFENVFFVCGAISGVLFLLTFYDEDVLSVEYVLLCIAGFSGVATVCRNMIPDENVIADPVRLITAVVAKTHYFPVNDWKGQAHTSNVRKEMDHMFEYTLMSVLKNIVSPAVTPFILLFYLRPKVKEIVDFYRNFTVEVVGVGDVCSFAQMDVRKHGSGTWQCAADMDNSDMIEENYTYHQTKHGKTEMSLLHFLHTNPEWKPTNQAETYVTNLRERAAKDFEMLVEEENPLSNSLNSISSLGNEYADVVNSIIFENQGVNFMPGVMQASRYRDPTKLAQGVQNTSVHRGHNTMQSSVRGRLCRLECPVNSPWQGIVAGGSSMSHSRQFDSQLQANSNMLSFANSFANPNTPSVYRRTERTPENNIFEMNGVGMSIDALYLHELHDKEVKRRPAVGRGNNSNWAASSLTHRRNNNQIPSRFEESQPQLHANILNQTRSTSSQPSSTEKTPLLNPSNAYGS